jgi:disulfide bond formation protein DsbB
MLLTPINLDITPIIIIIMVIVTYIAIYIYTYLHIHLVDCNCIPKFHPQLIPHSCGPPDVVLDGGTLQALGQEMPQLAFAVSRAALHGLWTLLEDANGNGTMMMMFLNVFEVFV